MCNLIWGLQHYLKILNILFVSLEFILLILCPKQERFFLTHLSHSLSILKFFMVHFSIRGCQQCNMISLIIFKFKIKQFIVLLIFKIIIIHFLIFSLLFFLISFFGPNTTNSLGNNLLHIKHLIGFKFS